MRTSRNGNLGATAGNQAEGFLQLHDLVLLGESSSIGQAALGGEVGRAAGPDDGIDWPRADDRVG